MNGSLYLAWKYIAFHRYKTAILVLSITLIVFVPAGLRVLIAQSAEQLTARAAATPLLIGAKGSPLELVLSSLYFNADAPPTIPYGESSQIRRSDLARPIPMYVRFRARKRPIVGTTLDYFELRGLRIVEGRQMGTLGECVVGARVARDLELAPGSSLVSSPESVFDLAGVYPLKMPVVGVLAPTHGPDDEAVFVDLKTTWVIEGLGHGHQDLAEPEAASGVLKREGNEITANASVVQYNEITEENVGSFHFHGDLPSFPITAVVAMPFDEKSSALLRGRYLSGEQTVQILRPVEVVEDLVSTVFAVEGYVIAAVVFVGVATLLTSVLVFLLSLRLRRREIDTMIKIGGARGRVRAVLGLEVVFVFVVSVVLAAGLTVATGRYGAGIIQALLLG